MWKIEDYNCMKLEPLKLKSSPESWMKVFWDENDQIIKDYFENGVDTQDPNLRHLISELDRRFSQLWHKVQHENNLK